MDGMDGSGKSMATRYLHGELLARGLDVCLTREIGGTPFGEAIRSMSLTSTSPVDPLARLLAFLASRVNHIEQVIKPNIAEGRTVLSDRYLDSTYVYQGVLDGLLPQYLELISTKALAHVGRRPDITVFILVNPTIAFERGEARTQVDNDQYKKDPDKAIKIAAAYQSIIDGLSDDQRKNIFIVDANGDMESVKAQLDRVARLITEGYRDQN